MVSALVVALALGVVQLALTLHVRNVLVSCASEGARLAAANDRALADGTARTDSLIETSLGGYAHDTAAAVVTVDGAQVVQVEITAPVPVVGLWGIGSMTVTAHAFEESDRG